MDLPWSSTDRIDSTTRAVVEKSILSACRGGRNRDQVRDRSVKMKEEETMFGAIERELGDSKDSTRRRCCMLTYKDCPSKSSTSHLLVSTTYLPTISPFSIMSYTSCNLLIPTTLNGASITPCWKNSKASAVSLRFPT